MKTKHRMNLMISALTGIFCMNGCAIQAGGGISEIRCSELAAPRSYKIYLYVTKEQSMSEKIAQALEYRANIALLRLGHDVKIVQDPDAVNSDGLSLRIDLLALDPDPLKKKMGVQYVVMNNSLKEVMRYNYEVVGPFVAYGAVVNKIGVNIAREIDELVKCLRGREKVKS